MQTPYPITILQHVWRGKHISEGETQVSEGKNANYPITHRPQNNPTAITREKLAPHPAAYGKSDRVCVSKEMLGPMQRLIKEEKAYK